MATRWALALIVTVLTACDNVEWGGADFTVVQPPPKETEGAAATGEEAEERMPTGPVLYYVRQLGAHAMLVPVAEIARDTLIGLGPEADPQRYGQRFIAEHLREGAEFTVYHHGTRVGTFVLQSAEIPGANVCPRTPRATGILELIPGASQVPEFLALAKSQAPREDRRRTPVTVEPDRRMQVMAPILAERALRARRAPLPGNWTRAMAQLTPVPLAGANEYAFASTFLVSDSLTVGLDDEGYSLFLIAQPVPDVGYDTAFVEFTDYARTGKAAPRVIDYLDWDRDGEFDLLLEVYGTRDQWFEAVGRSGGRWRQVLNTRCAAPASAAAMEEAPAQEAPPARPASASSRPSATQQTPAVQQPSTTRPSPAVQQAPAAQQSAPTQTQTPEQTAPQPRPRPVPPPVIPEPEIQLIGKPAESRPPAPRPDTTPDPARD